MAHRGKANGQVSGNASPVDTKQTGRREQEGGASGSHQAHDWANAGETQTQDQPDGLTGPDRDNRDIIDPDGSQDTNRNTERPDRTP